MVIREATISDAADIAKMHVDCWETTSEKSGEYPPYGGYNGYLKEYHSWGLGKGLLMRLLQHVSSMHMDSAFVWVLADNPACTFYEKLGARLVVEQHLIHIGGKNLNMVAYGWELLG